MFQEFLGTLPAIPVSVAELLNMFLVYRYGYKAYANSQMATTTGNCYFQTLLYKATGTVPVPYRYPRNYVQF
jgi:hypothetical protein